MSSCVRPARSMEEIDVRKGTTIALGVLMVLILGAGLLQLFILTR